MTPPFRSSTARRSTAGTRGPSMSPGGHVLQSRAWAEHRAAQGDWRPRYLAIGDVARPGAGSPVAAASAAGRRTCRAGPSWTGSPWTDDGSGGAIGAALVGGRGPPRGDGRRRRRGGPRGRGRRPGLPAALIRPPASTAIAEIQPSRHRMALPLPADGDAAAIMDGVAKATRQRIRRAERDGVAVLRWDHAPTPAMLDGALDGRDRAARGGARAASTTCCAPPATGAASGSGAPDEFVTWWVQRARRAGHLVYLEAREGVGRRRRPRRPRPVPPRRAASRRRTPRTAPSAATTTRARCTCCAGGRSSSRSRNDGPRWTWAGVDVAGARREPQPGEPTYGLYEHKRSFGATWVALGGAQERVARAWRYAAGRAAATGGPGRRAGERAPDGEPARRSRIADAARGRGAGERRDRSAGLVERLRGGRPRAWRAARRPADRRGGARPTSR